MTVGVNTPHEYSGWSVDVKRPNEPLIREVLGFIELHLDRWDQDKFLDIGECGMVGCFAGWAMLLSEFGEDVGEILNVGSVLDARVDRVRRQLGRSFLIRRLGLSVEQFDEIYTFVDVHDETGELRHPTFAELCACVEEATGIRYKTEEAA